MLSTSSQDDLVPLRADGDREDLDAALLFDEIDVPAGVFGQRVESFFLSLKDDSLPILFAETLERLVRRTGVFLFLFSQ